MSASADALHGSVTTRPRLCGIAWPLLLELFLGLLSGLIGVVLAARTSDAAGGAFALSIQLSATLFVLFRVIGAGAGVVVTQHLGAGHREGADRVARAVLGASTWLGITAALVAFFGAAALMQLMQAPPQVLPLAVPFLQALAPALLLDSWNASMASVMRAHLRMRETLIVLLIMHSCHLALAWPLMYGWGLIPALGLVGFAVALALSRLIGLTLHLALWRNRLHLRPTSSDWWRLRRSELSAVFHIGIPSAVEGIAHRFFFMVTIAVAAQLGAPSLAAHAYASHFQGFIVLFSMAISIAVEILVGHHIGAGEFRPAHRLVRRALRRGLALTFLLATLAALSSAWLLSWFTKDAQIIRMATILLWLTIIVELGRTFNLIVINALRATGDARYPMLVGLVSMPLVMTGGGWLLAIPLGFGVSGLWLAYAADEWLRGMLMWRRWASLRWTPRARKLAHRMRASVLSSKPSFGNGGQVVATTLEEAK
jgi:putative MATE family efflux protein